MTPTKKKQTSAATATWSGTAAELQHIARAVLVHAGTDAMWPLLNDVHIEVRDGHLLLAATDRFTLGVYRTGLSEHSGDPIEIRVPAPVLRSAVTMIGRRSRGEVQLRLTPDHVTLTFDHPQVRADAAASPVSYVMPAEPSTQPLWLRLVNTTTAEAMTATETVTGVNPAYLARFRHAAHRFEPILIHGPGRAMKPVLVTAGEHFIGLIMPVHVGASGSEDDGTDALTSWHNLAADPATPATAAKAA